MWLRLYLNRKGNRTQTEYGSIYYFYFESPLRKTKAIPFKSVKLLAFRLNTLDESKICNYSIPKQPQFFPCQPTCLAGTAAPSPQTKSGAVRLYTGYAHAWQGSKGVKVE